MQAPMNRPPGTLVLLRHAQSLWNLENRFSGWADMDLSEGGIAEAHRAGRLLRDHGLRFDRAFVSPLKRATQTLDIVRAELGQDNLPATVDWHLNERHYGALQGLDKAETAARYGAEQFQRWRRGYRDTPPPLAPNDPRHPRFDARYADLPTERLAGVQTPPPRHCQKLSARFGKSIGDVNVLSLKYFHYRYIVETQPETTP